MLTQAGDSINCKIKKVLPASISFAQVQDGKLQQRTLPRDQVKLFQYNYYPSDYDVINTSSVTKKPNVSQQELPRWRFGIGGGLGYRTASTGDVPPIIEEYLNGLKLGTTFNATGTYFLRPFLGFGFTHSSFFAASQIKDQPVTTSNGNTFVLNVSEDTYMHFTGPTVTTRFANASSMNSFQGSFGVGHMGYRNYLKNGGEITLEGKTLGFTLELAYDLPISDHWAVGFQLSSVIGSFTEVEVTTPTRKYKDYLEEKEDLNRIDLTIGLRFTK